jgi:hypothetical protein
VTELGPLSFSNYHGARREPYQVIRHAADEMTKDRRMTRIANDKQVEISL